MAPSVCVVYPKDLSVFIYEKPAELELLSSALEAHRSAKIDVKFVQRAKAEQMRKKYGKSIRSIDFGLFDQKILLVWDTDPKRALKGGSIQVINDSSDYIKYFLDLATYHDSDVENLISGASLKGVAL